MSADAGAAGAIAPEQPILHQRLSVWRRNGSMFHEMLWGVLVIWIIRREKVHVSRILV